MTTAISKPAPNTTLGFLKEHHTHKGHKLRAGIEEESLDSDDSGETEFERHHKERLIDEGQIEKDDDEEEEEDTKGSKKDECDQNQYENSDSLKMKQVVSNIIAFSTSGNYF